MANYDLQIGVLSPKFCNSFSLEIASVAGARNKWAQERTGARVSLARARSFLRPFIPSACYAG